jgi:hypothetical protein
VVDKPRLEKIGVAHDPNIQDEHALPRGGGAYSIVVISLLLLIQQALQLRFKLWRVLRCATQA